MFEYAVLMIFPAAMLYGALCDIGTMTIPNKVSLVLIGAFLVLIPLAGMPLDQVINHFSAGALCLLIGFGLFAAGIVGGGDAKLISAGALWVGYDSLLVYIMVTFLAGGLLALVMLLMRRSILQHALPLPGWMGHLIDRQKGMPYGVAIAVGALYVFPMTHLYNSIVT